ncbi:MAG TPA: enoyl-CoA hydratase-related protein [Candidatus Dormibacteraeota bacterium]|nr:enoyl-CoA hydratase-related protein [Candidatus Dormibacteraeota bacterium]HEX2679877.1 enoyl-CoA hydratase-related protein [Candidatus Dormibacteraeota bacterium]
MAEPPNLEQVLLTAQGHIANVTLNRPDQRNPLSATMLRDLTAAFQWCRDEPDVRVVVLTGAGRVFCAGADLSSFDGETSSLDKFRSRDLFVNLFLLMAELGKPIVGRINGHALAGGLGLACSCDILVAVDTATFGTPEINVGIWPMMIQAILSRSIPRKVVLEMEMLGDRWTATQLHSLGVINRVVTHELLDSTVDEIAQALAKKSPVAMRLGRDSFYRQQDMDFRAALHYLHGQFLLVSQTEDSREGIQAFFEKREPDFKGR